MPSGAVQGKMRAGTHDGGAQLELQRAMCKVLRCKRYSAASITNLQSWGLCLLQRGRC
jgi:hypothetical protein